jgi:DNA primase
MITRDTIEEVRSRMDIVDVVSDFVSLKKAGVNYKALSPFSTEKTPSFFVVPAKGIFKDFSSGKGGDCFTFIMEHEGLSYPEAIRYLAKKYGVEIKEDQTRLADEERVSDREALFIIMAFAKDYFKRLLFESEEGRGVGLSYFQERGFNNRTIEQFELGFALEQWDGLYHEAIKNGFSEEVLEKAGLIIKKENKTYDRFRGRVIFPVHNLAGKIVAFGARILSKEKQANQPKYINSPETDIYHKSNVLFGLFQAKNAIRQADNCFLVEGYTDVISMHQAGVENVVASSGTALTEEQIKLIKRFTDNITVLFDGDAAGIKAALRGIDMILKGGLNVRVVLLPDSEDPDSYSRKKSTSEFLAYLSKESKDFISFKAGLYAGEANKDPIKKAEIIQEIVNSVALIPNHLKRETSIQELSKILDVSYSVLNISLNKALINDRRSAKNPSSKEDIPLTVSEVHELSKSFLYDSSAELKKLEGELVKVLYNIGDQKESENEYVYQYIFYEADDITFIFKENSDLVDLYKSELAQGNIPTAESLSKIVPREYQAYVSSLVVPKYSLSEGWKKFQIFVGPEYEPNSAHVVVSRLKLGLVQKMIDDGLNKIKQAKDKKETDELIEIQAQIENAKKDISSSLGRVILRMPERLFN